MQRELPQIVRTLICSSLCPAVAGQSMPSNVAMKEYGFMESAEILFSEREKPRIIGRYT